MRFGVEADLTLKLDLSGGGSGTPGGGNGRPRPIGWSNAAGRSADLGGGGCSVRLKTLMPHFLAAAAAVPIALTVWRDSVDLVLAGFLLSETIPCWTESLLLRRDMEDDPSDTGAGGLEDILVHDDWARVRPVERVSPSSGVDSDCFGGLFWVVVVVASRVGGELIGLDVGEFGCDRPDILIISLVASLLYDFPFNDA